jgi:exodeoxyribonuclease V beta subunit
MSPVLPLDLLNVPLTGTNLIEASAGTGKTYAITGLFLRLLLEKNLTVQEILVVTFTEAATAELKDRIRTRLTEAAGAFAAGGSKDDFLNEIVRRHRDGEQAAAAVAEAIRTFDLAAISTIHGFCLRILRENAFESGSLFDTEVAADEANLTREAVEDFWRTRIAGASALFVSYALREGATPDKLFSLLGKTVMRPYLTVIPEPVPFDSSPEESAYLACFRQVRDAWPAARAEVERIFSGHEGLNRNRYRRAAVPLWLQGMDEYLERGEKDSRPFADIGKFTTGEIGASMKRDLPPPAHPFFVLCERLQEAWAELEGVFRRRLLSLKGELFRYARRELERRKRERNVMSFDDLLVRLRQALEERGGEGLALAVGGKLRAALIDEFQDTDPVQYAIFKKCFEIEHSTLFLIGDPKQAIYAFRGADLFAYMAASRRVQARYTLGENWRSEPALISGVNTVFAGRDHPFVFAEIPFHPAATAPGGGPEPLRIEGEAGPPLNLWFLGGAGRSLSGKPLTKGLARELLPRVTAAEVSGLLRLGRSNRAFIGTRPLHEGDIAILVRRNLEARLMQEALSGLNIASVLYSTGNLFDTHESLEVERLLRGVVEPHAPGLMKAAVATDLLGVKGEDLARLLEDETAWERWRVGFSGYHDLWRERGFIVMFRRLLAEQEVLPRLMSLPGGERRTTNVIHLGEVLHRAGADGKLGMAGLVAWLSRQREPTTSRLEEYQLRLESDERAVKLVTVHKSKGLEYPVVFCPFAWDGSRIRDRGEPLLFHGADLGLTLDLGSAEIDAHRVLAERELLAENLRLLYVALTRARNRCYLVWGRFHEGETSAPAYLFHGGEGGSEEHIVGSLAERLASMDEEAMLSDLRTLEREGAGAIRLAEVSQTIAAVPPPLPVAPVALTAKQWSATIERAWQVSSFSALVSQGGYRAELADRDEGATQEPLGPSGAPEPAAEREAPDRFSFPGGAKAGTLLHDILEHLDFSGKDGPPLEDLAAEKLEEYAFEPIWLAPLCTMVRKALSAPLLPERPGFALSCLERRDRLNELEFCFPLKGISPQSLAGIFAGGRGREMGAVVPESVGRLQFAPVRGYLMGYMDMVFRFDGRFYLVDWKSNHLGDRVEDYRIEALAKVMDERYYVLQYHLYTVALDQYLRLRLPDYEYERDFGGVFYVFLRGVEPDRGPEYGIFRDRPAAELVDALRENLIDRSDNAKGQNANAK